MSERRSKGLGLQQQQKGQRQQDQGKGSRTVAEVLVQFFSWCQDRGQRSYLHFFLQEVRRPEPPALPQDCCGILSSVFSWCQGQVRGQRSYLYCFLQEFCPVSRPEPPALPKDCCGILSSVFSWCQGQVRGQRSYFFAGNRFGQTSSSFAASKADCGADTTARANKTKGEGEFSEAGPWPPWLLLYYYT